MLLCDADVVCTVKSSHLLESSKIRMRSTKETINL